MAFAYFLSHAPRGFWPIVNGGELAALYCFLFLYVATQPVRRSCHVDEKLVDLPPRYWA